MLSLYISSGCSYHKLPSHLITVTASGLTKVPRSFFFYWIFMSEIKSDRLKTQHRCCPCSEVCAYIHMPFLCGDATLRRSIMSVSLRSKAGHHQEGRSCCHINYHTIARVSSMRGCILPLLVLECSYTRGMNP